MFKKVFSWKITDIIKCILGIVLFSISINLFIVPNNLYNGGILGLAQIIRTFIVEAFDLNIGFDISSIIYYLLNIPLFIIAYKSISKTFFARTLFCVTLNSIVLMLIPTPSIPIVNELITSVMIGGILGGAGVGLVLSSGGSTGGTDIIGFVMSKKNRMFSVGNIGLVFNIFIYGICGILYGIETMIYSIIYSVFDSIVLDKTHEQNICTSAFIFTKKNPNKMIDFIKNDLDRDATYWNATGGFLKNKTYIVYTVLSKYEKGRLERHMKDFDDKAFMVSNQGVSIKGQFEKKL